MMGYYEEAQMSPFGRRNAYDGVFTPIRPGQNIGIPEAKPFSPSFGRSNLTVPNQDCCPYGPPQQPKTLADRLAALNLPGLVENLGLQGQLTGNTVRVGVNSPYGDTMTEEQAVGAEAVRRREAELEANRRKYEGLLNHLRAVGIVDSSRLVETDD